MMLRRRRRRRRPKSSLVARLPWTSMRVLQVLRLPRKTSLRCSKWLRLPRKRSWRCSKCCACYAKPGGTQSLQLSLDFYEGASSAAPATQNEPEVLQVLRLPRKDLCEGASSAAPAAQNELEVLQVVRLPRKDEPEVLQVLCRPRKTRRRPKSSFVAEHPNLWNQFGFTLRRFFGSEISSGRICLYDPATGSSAATLLAS